jgi:hypothetical protein
MMKIDYSTVPVDYMAGAVQRYVENGLEPGGFMTALLTNHLFDAVKRADGLNIAHIPQWVVWIETNLPFACYGSRDKYQAWIGQLVPKEEPVAEDRVGCDQGVCTFEIDTDGTRFCRVCGLGWGEED